MRMGILAYVVAGFFLYAVNLIVLFRVPDGGGGSKALIVSIFLIPALLSWMIGSGLRGRNRWMRDLGVLLVSVSAFDAFLGLTFLCIFLTPEFRQMAQPETWSTMSDYRSGLICFFVYLVFGAVLLYSSSSKAVHPNSGQTR